MDPHWESPHDAPSLRDAALLSEVFESLRTQLTVPVEGAEPPTPAIESLISAALAELHRVSPVTRHQGGSVPVLGNGVVRELLRKRHEPDAGIEAEAGSLLDERR